MRTASRSLALVLLAAVLPLAARPAQAQSWYAILSGAAESPPNASAGTGMAQLTLTGDTLRVRASFSGLIGTTTAAHIHCCTAVAQTGNVAVASPTPSYPGFPAGVSTGAYDMTFDLSLAGSFSGAFVTAAGSVSNARTALVGGFDAGTAYFNVHTSVFPGGEIRGFFQRVPEPGALALLASGLLGLVATAGARRSRRTHEH